MAHITINDDDGEKEMNSPGEQQGGEGAESPTTEETAQLRKERDELFERLARSTADFKNSVKRMEADMESRLVYANSSLIKSLLPVIDNFERALAVDPGKTDASSIQKGLQLVHDQMMNVLK